MKSIRTQLYECLYGGCEICDRRVVLVSGVGRDWPASSARLCSQSSQHDACRGGWLDFQLASNVVHLHLSYELATDGGRFEMHEL